MTPSVADYIGRRRDSVWERDLAADLRKLHESERLAFIVEFARFNVAVAMILAQKCLQERASFVRLLDRGLESANPSGIRYWLDAIVPRMGIRRTLRQLRDRANTHADAMSLAVYWLSEYKDMPGYSQDEMTEFGEFIDSIFRNTSP